MGFLIDGNVFVAVERGKLDLAMIAEKHAADVLAISVVTASESLYGVYRARTPEVAQQRMQFVEYIVGSLTVVPFDLSAARVHARLWAGLQAQGQVIGSHDLMIAATALALAFTVLTLNEDEFRRVPGLDVLNPAAA
jgi:predicted nucleic acid-binding protein